SQIPPELRGSAPRRPEKPVGPARTGWLGSGRPPRFCPDWIVVMLTRALGRRFPVLANRNFLLLLADRLLAPAAVSFSLVGVSFAVLQVTRSPAHPGGSTAVLSYVLAAQLAPSLVFLLIGGVIADRIAPQLVII